MTGVLDGCDDCLAVVIHAPQLDAVALLVGIQKDIGRLEARRDRIADAAQIDDMSPANPAIERNMGMSNDNQVRLAASRCSSWSSLCLGCRPGPSSLPGEACTPSTRVPSGKVKRTSSGKFMSQSSQPAALR